jgi:hypothetical protein
MNKPHKLLLSLCRHNQGRNTCSVMQVSHGSTMFLYNMDFAMEWPRPLPPNVQLVGALLPTAAQPLPADFQVHTSSICTDQFSEDLVLCA